MATRKSPPVPSVAVGDSIDLEKKSKPPQAGS